MWLLEHAAMVVDVRAVGTDGKTFWRRIKGRHLNMRRLGFGEQAVYKLASYGPQKAARGSSSANFKQGTYIGFSKVKYEHRLTTNEGMLVTSRHAVGLPEPTRWDYEKPGAVMIMPWKSVRPRSGGTAGWRRESGRNSAAAASHLASRAGGGGI